MFADAYPGTERHQRVLRAVVSYYAPDPRVRAVLVFGSLGRGNWDRYSDLDLDIILADGVSVAPAQELERLCASFAPIGERAALIVPKRARWTRRASQLGDGLAHLAAYLAVRGDGRLALQPFPSLAY